MRNWKTYNDQLVKRGELLISLDFLENWDLELERMNSGKRGRAFIYPECFVKFLAPIRVFFGLPYRQEEGFVRALAKLLPGLMVPDYTTIYRRVSKFVPEFEESVSNLGEEIVIALDSTGIKVGERGEWVRELYGKKGKLGYLKIHVAVDVETKQILAIEVTDEKVADCERLKELVQGAEMYAKVVRVLADGAYDSKENFDFLEAKGIEPGIKPRRSSSGKARGSWSRMYAVREFLDDEEAWKLKVGFGKRWSVESAFSSFKRTFGEFVSAKKFEHMVNELKLKAFTYNLLISLVKQ